ncbi:unnamed protein product [Brachionus calyciflorus]|uniref:Uncharacterized protein n=1 Tax=Brachionus calyciflorus TaxID=104777 RepID=A0A814K391_9BILA|nr:unnamed protein product [Brachionus calyciflorus]
MASEFRNRPSVTLEDRIKNRWKLSEVSILDFCRIFDVAGPERIANVSYRMPDVPYRNFTNNHASDVQTKTQKLSKYAVENT